MPITFTETNVEQKFNLRIDNFYGGLNTRDLDSKVADNELTDVRNFNFDKRAALSMRKGFAKFNATAIGSVPIKSLGGYYKTSSTAEKIATAGTQIYSASSTTFSSIATGLTSGLVFDMHQFMNKFFMANGTDACRVYNGTTTYTAGYTAPSSGVTAAQGSTGVLEARTDRSSGHSGSTKPGRSPHPRHHRSAIASPGPVQLGQSKYSLRVCRFGQRRQLDSA